MRIGSWRTLPSSLADSDDAGRRVHLRSDSPIVEAAIIIVFAVCGSLAVGMEVEDHPSWIAWPSADTRLPFAVLSPSATSCSITSTASAGVEVCIAC